MFWLQCREIRNTSAFGDVCVGKGWAACSLHVARTICFGRINSAYYSALAKVDFSVVLTTSTFCCQPFHTAPRMTFVFATFDAVTYEVF